MKLKKKYLAMLLTLNCMMAFSQNVTVSGFLLFQNGKTVQLNWVLDSGATCNGTTIFRSIDSINYVQIGYIPGICGNVATQSAYTFKDENSVVNKTNCYKLRFGFTQYSEVRCIFLKYIDPGTILIKPSLASETVTLEFNNDAREIFSLTIYDAEGRSVYLKEGINESVIKIDVRELVGTYLYNLTKNNITVYKGKFIIGH